MVPIPFNKPFLLGTEMACILDAHVRGQLAGDGHYTRLASEKLKLLTGSKQSLLTHSCTGALEMAAQLLNIKPGDEVIMPSYTFVSTANAFVLRGAVPVFVDIRRDTLNIDETLIESAITSRTRAVVPVHYAGVPCEMDRLCEIADSRGLYVIEDAAQGICATYKGRALGSIGQMGTLSFHETKNVISGEGGALLINDDEFSERAETVRQKGTNRSSFYRGQVDKYTWIDIGSSFLPGEITSAFLYAQLEQANELTQRRLAIWQRYHESFEQLEKRGLIRRPIIPDHCDHNAHIYHILLKDLKTRTKFIERMSKCGVSCVFHYIPLHTSPAGLKFGRASGNLTNTIELSDRLVRLPLWLDMSVEQQDTVIEETVRLVKSLS